MVETIQQLEDLLRAKEVAVNDDLMISPREWDALIQWVPYWNVVIGSADEPPMFWFRGRRIRQQIRWEGEHGEER